VAAGIGTARGGRARGQVRRPKACKLACPELAAQVMAWLEQWWSPVQISRRLRRTQLSPLTSTHDIEGK